jgi:20S proteasome alpha/beta subunit
MKLFKDPTLQERIRQQKKNQERESASEDKLERLNNRIMNAAIKRRKRKDRNLKLYILKEEE